MTNLERVRRHLNDNAMCASCQYAHESLLHLLRDCHYAKDVWDALVPDSAKHLFFSLEWDEWLSCNLKLDYVDDVQLIWSMAFSITIWWLWKWRNDRVFRNESNVGDKPSFIRKRYEETIKAYELLPETHTTDYKHEVLVRWCKPNSGWVKVNTDGASKGNPGQAAAGGIIRDENGEWLRGFVANLGITTAPAAELWGIARGISLAWDRGFRQVHVEVDSEVALNMIKKGVNASHPLASLVIRCQGFLIRDWVVRFSHTFREGNRAADLLANFAFSYDTGFFIFDDPPPVLGILC